MFFRDLSHWENTILPLLKDKKEDVYFCDTKAYGGSPIATRSRKNAASFWNVAATWMEFLKEKKMALPIPYKDAHSFFTKKDNFNGLRSIGDLIIMLLLGEQLLFASKYEGSLLVKYSSGDLIYAGIVKLPSDETFVTDFLTANKGAVGGLVVLKVLEDVTPAKEKGKKTKQAPKHLHVSPACMASTLQLYRYVKGRLQTLGLSHLLPDIIHFEHLLCKVLRVSTRFPIYQFIQNIPVGVENSEEEEL